MFDATGLFHLHRLPEVFGGQPRDQHHPHPGIYPGACSPQAWSSSAIIFMITALLGLLPLAPLGTLIVDPDLPEWLPEITLKRVRVGDVRASLHFRRNAQGRTEHTLLTSTGPLKLVRPDAVGGAGDRIEAVLKAALA